MVRVILSRSAAILTFNPAGAIANAITVIQHSTFADRDFNIKTVMYGHVSACFAHPLIRPPEYGL